MVLLAGDPGIGKSRLCQEFAGHVRATGAIVLHGSCTELTGWAFEPFAQPLRHCLARVADVSGLVGSRPDDLARIVPEIRTRIPGLEPAGGADAETARHFLFEAVTSWLVELTRHAPVLFVLDDLSWADDASITLLRHLLPCISGERVMFVMTYRPGDATTRARRFLQDERAAVRRVDLAGLDLDQALVFTEGALGGTLDRGGRELIISAARSVGGNPLYLGEVVSHLTESAGLVSEAAGWTVGPGLEPKVVPPTVTDVIMRRIDRLGQSTQRLLRVASVVGTAIDPPLLFELLDSNMAESAQALEDATEAGFLRHVAGRDRYEFTHAVFRDVLYSSQIANVADDRASTRWRGHRATPWRRRRPVAGRPRLPVRAERGALRSRSSHRLPPTGGPASRRSAGQRARRWLLPASAAPRPEARRWSERTQRCGLLIDLGNAP